MNMFLGEISLALSRMYRRNNFDEERQKSSDAYKRVAEELSKKPADTDSLTAWASALMKLNLYAKPKESEQIVKAAMSKLGRALELDPTHHKALWQLGHTHNALAYLMPDLHAAEMEFDKALECFQKADQLCPGNSEYLRALRSNMANREWYKAKHIRGYKPNFKKGTHGHDGGSVAENLPELHKTQNGEIAAKEPELHTGGGGGLFDKVGGGSRAKEDAQSDLELEHNHVIDVVLDAERIQTDLGRQLKHACKIFYSELNKNPAYICDCGRWIKILMQAFEFGYISERKEMLKDEVTRLGEALETCPSDDIAMWDLGRAHSAIAFLTPDLDAATYEFDLAFQCFLKAVRMCPENRKYLRSLKLSATHEPDLHKAMYGALDQVGGESAASSSAAAIKGAKKKRTWSRWDTLACGFIAVLIVMGQGAVKIKGPLHFTMPKHNQL